MRNADISFLRLAEAKGSTRSPCCQLGFCIFPSALRRAAPPNSSSPLCSTHACGTMSDVDDAPGVQPEQRAPSAKLFLGGLSWDTTEGGGAAWGGRIAARGPREPARPPALIQPALAPPPRPCLQRNCGITLANMAASSRR